ncbi:YhcH/YjgK/YiaL family protein [Flavonifractor plautii]|uniref:YhcH/YjgK/YiaL family protein n=1 Tax=Flavonifractor plautii TaxID=292800 RepID=UPI003EEA42C4
MTNALSSPGISGCPQIWTRPSVSFKPLTSPPCQWGGLEIPGGDIYYNHFTYTTALISQASLFEAHERYLDLHIVLSGCEQVALAPVESLDEAEVRADEDSTMYRGTPEYSVTLDQNRFLLVFPGEGHLPKLSDRVPMNIDKLVLKIPC